VTRVEFENPIVKALAQGLTPHIRQAIADEWHKSGIITDEEYWSYCSKTDWFLLLFKIAERRST
jgi:hypothetical protein